MGAPLDEFAPPLTRPAAVTPRRERRQHRRVSLQLPVRIRDYRGRVEVTKTEDVSKGGFCYVSQENYYAGEGMLTVCPYSPNGHNIEIALLHRPLPTRFRKRLARFMESATARRRDTGDGRRDTGYGRRGTGLGKTGNRE